MADRTDRTERAQSPDEVSDGPADGPDELLLRVAQGDGEAFAPFTTPCAAP